MRVALNALGVGRLTLPAACSGLAYESLKIARRWWWKEGNGDRKSASTKIASKLADMAADAYATDSMVRMTSALVDAKVDFRMESALCNSGARRLPGGWSMISCKSAADVATRPPVRSPTGETIPNRSSG